MKNKEKFIPSNNDERNIISQGTEIVGNINSKGNLRIDGKLTGDINISGKLVIGKTGFVKGIVDANMLDNEGHITGKVNIHDTLSIKSTGSINGEVKTSKLHIENGAIFNVTCTMGNNQTSQADDIKK